MTTEMKAVVFKTHWLKETKEFYAGTLGLRIVESSKNHFVISLKGVRFLFVSSNQNFEVELYLSTIASSRGKKMTEQSCSPEPRLIMSEDPNGIKVIISKEKAHHEF